MMIDCPACGGSVEVPPRANKIRQVSAWAGSDGEVMQLLRAVAPQTVSAQQLTKMLKGRVNRSYIYRALKSLVDSGEVECSEVKDRTCCKPYRVYRALKGGLIR
jgi:hypothetical protein